MEKPLKIDGVIGADRIRPISETLQIELKLTPRVGHHTSSPPLEAFGVTTNGLAYRGRALVEPDPRPELSPEPRAEPSFEPIFGSSNHCLLDVHPMLHVIGKMLKQ